MAFDPNYILAAVAAGGVGLGAGRWATHWFSDRSKRRLDEDEFRHSVMGWPADKYQAARPGLIQKVDEHIAKDDQRFDALEKRSVRRQ